MTASNGDEGEDDPGLDGDGQRHEAKDCQEGDDQPNDTRPAGSPPVSRSIAAHVEPRGARDPFRARASRSICKRMR